MDETTRAQLQRYIEVSRRIVVLSGAGMSTESGIPDFRSPGGIWEDEETMIAMSLSYWQDYPQLFWPKFKRIFMNEAHLQAQPNEGHYAIARLEDMGKEVTVLTQNVDGLHQLAGSTHVLEMHGGIRQAVCPVCQSRYDLDYVQREEVPRCSYISIKGAVCDAILQANVVLFEQEVRYLPEALRAVRTCDLMLVLGTSLTVYPVADLPRYVIKERTKLVIVNLDATDEDQRADLVIHDKIGKVLAEAVL